MIKKNRNKGVSPIVGVILMVVLAILLAALISQFSLELEDILEPPVTAGVNIQESYNVQDDSFEVKIVWSSGGTVDTIHAIEPDGSRTASMTEVGDDIRVDSVSEGDQIRIIGTVDSGEQGVLQEYTVG